jgi:outer membrane protein OmpA-like peptidoglycan-associated protein
MRDPLSPSIASLLAENGIKNDNLTVIEKSFSSLSPAIIKRRIESLAAQYTDVIVEDDDPLVLKGRLSWNQMQSFDKQYYAITGIEKLNVDRSGLLLEKLYLSAEQPGIKKQLFEQLVGEISRIQIQFSINETTLDETARLNIQSLSILLRDVFELADQLELSASLIIIGASDSSGLAAKNQRLSLERANAVKAALINQGMTVSKLFATGIGEVELSSDAMATRRVMFNTMYSDLNSKLPSANSQ